MILSDFAAAVTIQFIINLIVIAYLAFVLGINFGEQWALVVLTSLTGGIMGVSLGIFVGSFMKGDENKASGILSAVILFLCFLSGLMYGNMKDVIERNIPVINRINPAALLSDAYYCLVVYDTYSRYILCIISMLVISGLFCAASAFVLRRKKYASI
jgi:ABC-2 type transport system permease protein